MSEVLTGISGEIQRFLQRVGDYGENGFIKEFEKNDADLSEEIDNTADFSFPENFDDNLDGWTNAISDYWNSSVKECLDKIIESYNNMKNEDTYESPNRDAGNSFGEDGNEKWVKPNLNKKEQTYADARTDELTEVLKNKENLDFTEENVSKYFTTRLLMPQYRRRVEVEDLNRNFWVIGQSIQALSDFAFGDGSPLDMTIKSLISELVGIWDNVYRIWQSIFKLAKKIDELQKQVNDLSAGTQKTGTTINLGVVWTLNKSFWDLLFKWVNVKKQDETGFVDLTHNSKGFPFERRQDFQYYFFGTERITTEGEEHWIFQDQQEIINQGYSWVYETEDKIIYDSYDEDQNFREELFLPGYNGFLYNHTTTKEILNEIKEKAGAYKAGQLIDLFKGEFPVKLSSVNEKIRDAEAIKDNLALISVRAPRLGCIVKYPQIDTNGILIEDENKNTKYFYMAWDLAHPLSTYDIIHSNDGEINNFKKCITNYKENKKYLSIIDDWNTKAFDMFNYANWAKGGHTEFVLNRSIYEGLNFEYDLDENKNIQSTNMISSNILDAKVDKFKFIEYKRSSTGADAREMAKVLFDISKLNLVARCYQKGHNLSYEYATPWDFIPALFEPIEDDYWNNAMEYAYNTFVEPSSCTPVDLTLFFKLPIFKKYYYIDDTAKNLLECYDNFKKNGTKFPDAILTDIENTIRFIQKYGCLNKIIKIFGKKIKCCSNPTIYTTTANNGEMLNELFLKTNENNEKVSFFKNVQPINWGWTATLYRDFDMCNTMDWDEQYRQFGEENTPDSAYADIDQGIVVPYLNKRFEYEDYSGKIKLRSHQGGIEANNGHKDRIEIMLEDGFMQGMRIAAENFDNTLETVVSVGEGGLHYSQDKRDYEIDYLANYLIPNVGGDIRGYGFQFDVSPYDRHFKQAIISFDFRGVNTGNLIYGNGVDIIQFSNSSISINYNLSNTKDKGKNALLQDVFRINEPMPISVPRDDCSQYTVKQLVESEQEDKTNPYLFRYYSMEKTYTNGDKGKHIYKFLVDGQLGLYNENLYKPLKSLSVNRVDEYNTGDLPTVINKNNVAIFSPNALTNYYLTQFSALNNIYSPALRNTSGVINMNNIKLGTTYPSLPYYKIFNGEDYTIQKYEEYNTMKITDIYGEANERYVNPALYFDVENIFTGWATYLILFPKFIKEELAPLGKDWITASEGKTSNVLEAPISDENGIIKLSLYNDDGIIKVSSLKKTLTELSRKTSSVKTLTGQEIYFLDVIEDFKDNKENLIKKGAATFLTLGDVKCKSTLIIEKFEEKQKIYFLSFNIGDENNSYGEIYSGIIIENLVSEGEEETYIYKSLKLNNYNKMFINDIRCNLFKNDSDVPAIDEKDLKNIISDFIIGNEYNKYYFYDIESGKLTIYFGTKNYYKKNGEISTFETTALYPIYQLNHTINDCMWIYKLEIFGFNDAYEIKEGDNSNEDYNYLTAQWIINEDNIFNKTKRAYYTENDSPLPTLDDFINAENDEEKNAIKPVDYLSWFGFQYLNNGT